MPDSAAYVEVIEAAGGGAGTGGGAGGTYETDDGAIKRELANAIMGLWKDPSVQATFARSREYHLNDSCS